MRTIAEGLVRAQERVAAGDLAGGLELAVEVWGGWRDPALADLIEAMSAACVGELAPIVEADAWLPRLAEGDARSLAVLLPVVAQAPVSEARARLDALAERRPDPRVATAMVEQLERLPFTATGGVFYTAAHRLLRDCQDPRSVARLRALAGGFGARLGHTSVVPVHERQVQRSLAALEQAAARLRPADERTQAALAGLREAVDEQAERVGMGARLLAQVRAEPESLRHREVYADWLLARGDPLGEFIVLQLADAAGQLDRRGQARMRALEREHAPTWLGPLRWLLRRDTIVFERGFVVAGRISRHARSPAILAGVPEWATIERLAMAPLTILLDPVMLGLREVEADEAVAVALLDRPGTCPRVTTLTVVVGDPHDAGWSAAASFQRALNARRGLAGLRRFVVRSRGPIDVRQLRWLWVDPGLGLDAVELDVDPAVELDLTLIWTSVRKHAAHDRTLTVRRGPLAFELIPPTLALTERWQLRVHRLPDGPDPEPLLAPLRARADHRLHIWGIGPVPARPQLAGS